MPSVQLHCEGDGCWPDLNDYAERGRLINLMGYCAPPIGLALLPHGMASGKPSVTIRLDLPHGAVLVTETSLALLEDAVKCCRAYLEGKAERDRQSRDEDQAEAQALDHPRDH